MIKAIVYVIQKMLKNITMHKKILSMLVVPVMSPYPVVDAAVQIA